MKLLIGFLLIFSLGFSCEIENMHTTGELLISRGFVKIEGQNFIIYQNKIEEFIKENSDNSNVALIISLTLLQYPKEHNLNLIYR